MLKNGLFLSVLLLFVSASAFGQDKPIEDKMSVFAKEKLKEADRLVLEGDLVTAMTIILELRKNEAQLNSTDKRVLHDQLRVIFIRLEMYDEAIVQTNLVSRYIDEDEPLDAEYHRYASLAYIAFKRKKFDQSIAYYHDAIRFAEASNYFMGVLGAINNIGMCYQNMEEWQLATEQFKLTKYKLDSAYPVKEDHVWDLFTATTDNEAYGFELAGNIDAAISMYHQNWRMLDSLQLPEVYSYNRWIRTSLKLGELQTSQRNAEEALRFLKKAEELVYNENVIKKYDGLELKNRLNEAYLNYFLLTMNSDSVAKYDGLVKTFQSEQEERLRTMLSKIGTLFKLESDLTIEKQRQLERIRSLRNISWVAFICILGLVVAFFYSRLKRKQSEQYKTEAELAKANYEVEKLEVEKLNISLEHSKKDIEELAILVSKKEELLNRLSGLSKKLKRSGSVVEKQVLELAQDIQDELSLDRGKLDIQRKAVLLNDQFYRKLEENYPQLTEADHQLCAQLRMKLSNKEIAILRGVSSDSVTQAKSRLRKKIGLPVDQDLQKHLSTF